MMFHSLLKLSWPVSDELGPSTINMGILNGGKAPNVIADEAFAKGSIRASVKTEEILNLLKSNLHKDTSINIPIQFSASIFKDS